MCNRSINYAPTASDALIALVIDVLVWLSTAVLRCRFSKAEDRYSQRLSTVESVFGNLESNKGLNRFTLRGKSKVNAQWLIYCMVHNLEEVATQGATKALSQIIIHQTVTVIAWTNECLLFEWVEKFTWFEQVTINRAWKGLLMLEILISKCLIRQTR